MPREGTKTLFAYAYIMRVFIEIRYAPGGDENHGSCFIYGHHELLLRLDMPREGTKTSFFFPISLKPDN